MIDLGTQAAQDPEKRTKNSEAVKIALQAPETRKKVLNHLAKTCQSRHVKIKATKLTQEFRECESNRWKERWASSWGEQMREYQATKEFKDKVSAGTKIALSEPTTRKKLSAHAVAMITSGTIGPNHSQREWIYDELENKNIYVHSSWEKRLFLGAQSANIHLERNHNIQVQYLDENNVERTYVPDFINVSARHVIEVKGWLTPRDECKHSACEIWCADNDFKFVLLKSLEQIDCYLSKLSRVNS